MEIRSASGMTIAVAFVAAFGLGGALSWFAFGAPRGVDLVAGNGNTADWVAAVGTWVIGVAAAYYARQAHLQRNDEIRERRMAELERKDVFLSSALVSGIPISTIKNDIRKLVDLPASERTVEHLRDLIEVLQLDVEDVRFSEEVLNAFTGDMVLRISTINNRAIGIRRIVRSICSYLDGTLLGGDPPPNDEPLTVAEDTVLKKLLEVADEISAEYEAFIEALIEIKVDAAMKLEKLKGI